MWVAQNGIEVTLGSVMFRPLTVWLHEIVKDAMISFKKAELSKFT